MWRIATLLTVSIAVLACALQAHAQGPLVEVAWLKDNLAKHGLVVLDVRATKDVYLKGHVPGAIWTDYAKGGWRVKDKNGVEGMLPAPEAIAALFSSHGIDNDTHVVIASEGQRAQDMGIATRLYWTFKVAGHDKVSILNGGMAAWLKIDVKTKQPLYPVETAETKPAVGKAFKVALRKEMLIGTEDVKAAIQSRIPLVDNRPIDFHVGLSKSPAAKTAGTIPTAVNLPEAFLTRDNGGFFRTRQELEMLHKLVGLPTTGRQITFCNTGHWASLGWFVASEIMGNKDVQMYDGSMAEWTANASAPVERKMKLE
jgi:thiosulfate/3-mercaptopyruvate sulfurtransferase